MTETDARAPGRPAHRSRCTCAATDSTRFPSSPASAPTRASAGSSPPSARRRGWSPGTRTCKEVLGDASRFSVAGPRPFEETAGLGRTEPAGAGAAAGGNLLGVDPPEHTRLRRMLTPEFTVRRMRRLEPRIAEIVDAHLDALEQAGPPADLVADFALPVPSLVICELLGVPYADRTAFQARTARQLDLSIPIPERLELGRASRAYMAGLVARAQAAPGDDMLGMLVREHGDDLTVDELVGIAGLLLRRRARDHVEHAGAGHARPAAPPRAARRWCATTRTRVGAGGRGAAALARDRALRRPAHHDRRRRAGRRRDPGRLAAGPRAGDGQPRPGARRRPRPPRRHARTRAATSRSATASTTASARRWRAWRCGSRSRPCSAASRTWRWRCHSTRSASAPSTSFTGCTPCR